MARFGVSVCDSDPTNPSDHLFSHPLASRKALSVAVPAADVAGNAFWSKLLLSLLAIFGPGDAGDLEQLRGNTTGGFWSMGSAKEVPGREAEEEG